MGFLRLKCPKCEKENGFRVLFDTETTVETLEEYDDSSKWVIENKNTAVNTILCNDCGHKLYNSDDDEKDPEDILKTLVVREPKFKCPACGRDDLGAFTENLFRAHLEGETVTHSKELAGTVNAYGCADCIYIIEDEQGNAITDQAELIRWIKANCPQK